MVERQSASALSSPISASELARSVAQSDRFAASATVALQHPQFAVEQLEYAIKTLGCCGLSVCTSVAGQEL
jgi:predicted TIM-barrel fold metal-dependent hydrolase